MEREETLKCPNCGLNWTPARTTKVVTIEGKTKIVPDDYVRCVECKKTYYRPISQIGD